MPLYFQARSDSSVDPISGITITQPRVLPSSSANGQPAREYQYAFLRDGKLLHGIGFLGTESVVRSGLEQEWVYTFDLGHEHLITAMLKCKAIFGSAEDDDFVFLRGLAQGLVLAYAGQTDNDDNLRYVAETSTEALGRAGVLISDETPISSEGKLVLAEVSVPAHLD